jgi:gliding motility-associated-like protein
MKKLLFLSLNILIGTSLFAQQGKDGAGNITTANTIVNNVSTTLTSNAAIGTTTIAVASVAGLSAGDLLFIMQAQGATVHDSTNYWGNPNDALPNDTSSGKVTKYNGAGNNEFAEINSIVGNVITLNCTLSDSFRGGSVTLGSITTQVIRVQRYTSLTLSGAGSITCNTWNGATGGVVVIEVQGNTTLAAGTSITASAKGFRGGSPIWATGFGSTSTGHNYGSPSANNGAHKGESIVGDTNQYKKQVLLVPSVAPATPTLSPTGNMDPPSEWWNSTPLAICKANVANGGGGGDAMNCGGGGGSNGGSIALWNGMGNPDITTSASYTTCWALEPTTPANGTVRPTSSSGGGRGGYAFSAHSTPIYASADPTISGPNAFTGTVSIWAGDDRHNDGGWGGIPLDYSTGKIFLGGGAGAGDGNDGHASPGGNGGGIIYLVSYGTVTGAGQIISDGGSPLPTSSFHGTSGDDGAGGGGGGGTILIKSVGTISLTAATPISAQGGKGGNQDNNTANNDAYGPGGGGGGGYVSISNAVTGVNINGGANGLVTGSNTSSIKTKFPPNGATGGGVGSSIPSIAPFYLTAKNDTVCPSSTASLSVTVNGTTPSGLSVEWYTVATGGTPVSSSASYTFTSPATANTYTYYAGTCPGTYRIPVILVVNSSSPPTVTVTATNTTVCSGTNVILTASTTATSYTWSANAGSVNTSTASVNPTTNPTTYTVIVANTGACAGTNTASININVIPAPTITITLTSYSICSGINDTLKASGATTYTWSSNAASATTSSVSVLPTSTGVITYSVIGSNGGTCSSTQTATINVTATPTITISPANATICTGSSTTFTASGATTSYSWSTSATTNTVSVSPTNNATYTVTGYNNTCSNTQTVSVTVSSSVTPTLMINATNTTICSGTSVTLTVSGATSYTWGANAGSATTNTVLVTPTSNTTYTVTGANTGSCAGTNTASISINVNSSPTVTITPSGNTTFCNGGSVTLTSSSAVNNVWNNTGSTAQTITVTTSGVYTLTTTASGCQGFDTITVNVKNNPPTPVVSDTTITECQNSIQTIHFNHSAGSTVIIYNAAGQLQPLPFKPTTVGTTTYIAHDSLNSCVSATKNITIKINAAPTTAPTVTTPVTYCYGQTTDTLQALPTTAGGYLIWEDVNHNVLTTPPTPSPSSTIPGTTTYYVYQSTYYCPSNIYDSIQVIVLNKPNANFTTTPSTSISLGQSVSFAPVQTTTANTYYWNFEDPAAPQANTSSITLPSHAYSVAGSYCPKLIVTNSLGCKDSTTLCLDISTNVSLSIPNVFSPNGDGINDFFSVKSTGITTLSCDIFDRWGLKLYTWNGVSGYWDGTEKSGKAVDGTYFYVIQTTDVQGVSQTNKGFIELIR